MPWGDRTGPLGLGPRTGRALGYCAGYPVPGYMNPGFGRGFGWRRWGPGRGRGFGWRRWWRFAPVPVPVHPQLWEPVQIQPHAYQPSKQEELQMLEDEAKAIEQEQKTLKQELEEIRKRIEELKKQK